MVSDCMASPWPPPTVSLTTPSTIIPRLLSVCLAAPQHKPLVQSNIAAGVIKPWTPWSWIYMNIQRETFILFFCMWLTLERVTNILTVQGIKLAAIDGVGGDTGVKTQHRYVTCPPRHRPPPSFRFFYSNTNNSVKLEDTTIKTECSCSMQRTELTRFLHHSSLSLHCRGCPDQISPRD